MRVIKNSCHAVIIMVPVNGFDYSKSLLNLFVVFLVGDYHYISADQQLCDRLTLFMGSQIEVGYTACVSPFPTFFTCIQIDFRV
jgi:hypothetical protein